jgi:hypothetical protein
MPRPSDTDPVTPTEMLARVRSRRAAAIAAEADLLVLAAEWADAHPDLDHDPEDPDAERGIPGWCWSASAPFAAALGRSTASGEALIRDALVLRHRLPSVWSQVVRGGLEAWRARRIAQTVLGAHDDVCAHLDSELAAVAATVGAVTLERLLDEAMLRLHPEERELAQFTALDHRHATLHAGSINHTGVADMTLRGDWKDLHDFDQALSRVAAALGALDEQRGDFVESLDVRRARAVGVLADPVGAASAAGRQGGPAHQAADPGGARLAGGADRLRPGRALRDARPPGARAAGPRLVRTPRHPRHGAAGDRPRRPRPDRGLRGA